MTPAAKPRRWTIRYHGYKDELGAASLFAQNWPEFESDIEIIEASAYDAIEKQLEIERRKVEKLREQRDKWSSMCAGYSMTWRAQVHEREDAELEAIDEGRE